MLSRETAPLTETPDEAADISTPEAQSQDASRSSVDPAPPARGPSDERTFGDWTIPARIATSGIAFAKRWSGNPDGGCAARSAAIFPDGCQNDAATGWPDAGTVTVDRAS